MGQIAGPYLHSTLGTLCVFKVSPQLQPHTRTHTLIESRATETPAAVTCYHTGIHCQITHTLSLAHVSVSLF